MVGKPRRRALPCLVILSLLAAAWAIPLAGQQASGAPGTFTFAASGDLAWNGDTDSSLNKLAGLGGVSFFMALGDLGYSPAPGWCSYFKGKFQHLEFIAGNHDTTESGPGVLYRSNGYIKNCPFTLGLPVTGEYGVEYYFDYPSGTPLARFILVAPGIGGELNYDYSQGTSHYNWVVSAIDAARSAGIPWVIVGMHKPCLNTGSHGCSMPASFEQMLLAKRVDLVLQGHDHNYQRTKQLTCEVIGRYDPSCIASAGPTDFVKGSGTIKLIIGTFGAGFYSINPQDPNYAYYVATQADSHGFMRFTITPTSLSADFVASTGSFKDSFSITRPTPPPSVFIGSPRNRQAFDVARIVVSGIATDKGGAGLRGVEVRIGGGQWLAANGTSPWNTTLDLRAGANLMEARAWDNLGSVSVVANVTATYNPPPPAPPPPPPPPVPPPTPPVIAANIVATGVAGPTPFTATFAVEIETGTPPYSFRWDFGDGIKSTLERPTHTFERPGTYVVVLIVTDAAGLTSTRKVEVTASPDGTTTFRSPSPGMPWTFLVLAAVAAASGGAVISLWIFRRRRRAPPGG